MQTGSRPFAIASYYRNWYDQNDDEVVRYLEARRSKSAVYSIIEAGYLPASNYLRYFLEALFFLSALTGVFGILNGIAPSPSRLRAT